MRIQQYIDYIRSLVISAKNDDPSASNKLGQELQWNEGSVSLFISALSEVTSDTIQQASPPHPLDLLHYKVTRNDALIELLNAFLPGDLQMYNILDLDNVDEGVTDRSSVMDGSYNEDGIHNDVAASLDDVEEGIGRGLGVLVSGAAGTSEGFGAGGAGAGDAADHVVDLVGGETPASYSGDDLE